MKWRYLLGCPLAAVLAFLVLMALGLWLGWSRLTW